MKTLYLLPIFLFFLLSCSDRDAEKHDSLIVKDNLFTNTTLQEIVDLQNDRNTEKLLPYLKSSKAIYRETATLAFASIQDAAALNDLIILLEEDKSEKVRIAASFAIGQIADTIVQSYLLDLFDKEKSEKVKTGIAEAIGKCGNENGLHFLVKQIKEKKLNIAEQKAALLGLARFSLRGIFSNEALETVLQIIIDENTNDAEVLYYASISLTRLKDFNLTAYSEKLIKVFERTTHLYTQLNLISALANTYSPKTIDFIRNIISGPYDYRLKVNAIRVSTKYKYDDAKEMVFEALKDSSLNVAIQASEFFFSNGSKTDVNRYLEMANQASNWRIKTNLLATALKYKDVKLSVSKLIISSYNKSSNPYEKANLLLALSSDITSYKFVSQKVHESNDLVISTYGMMSLAEMRKNKSFDSINSIFLKNGDKDLNEEFAFIFKDAIMSKDLAKITIAAGIIRDPELNFRKLYENTYFLTQALNNCKLPHDMEAYLELQKAINYIDGKEETPAPKIEKKPLDWAYISKIPFNQKVKIITSKGDILLELYVNLTPVSVANFIKLAEADYFDDKNIHRVVPNFVIQDGCSRGDGWGGPDYAICSELALNYYTEGSLGMASSGKDTESSQWFITHSPTPHLDGRYTNFGQVIEGMEVVHKLEVGDKIIDVEIIK